MEILATPMTIGEMIKRLQDAAELFGSDKILVLKDNDTDWILDFDPTFAPIITYGDDADSDVLVLRSAGYSSLPAF